MINTFHTPKQSDTPMSFDKKKLFDALKEDTQRFSWTLKFKGLDYDTKREKLDDFDDEITDVVCTENFKLRNIFLRLIREMTKNAADHSGTDATVELSITKNPEAKTISIKFLISDDWEGFPYTEEKIQKKFDTLLQRDDRKQKWSKNRWIWLSMIKAAAQQSQTDLILHNRWNIIHLNDIGLQKESKTQERFWYEGLGIFDIAE
jgi:signal transduction histidine kinase